MSVSAEIETRSRTNALAVPIASVTTRVVKAKPNTAKCAAKTNSIRDSAGDRDRLPRRRQKIE